VLLVGGEFDALSARDNGIEQAVTTCAGEHAWPSDLTRRLAGRKVAIALDADEAGRIAADNVRRLLDPAYVHTPAAAVAVVDLSPVKDVNDWFRSGRTKAELVQLIRDARRWGNGERVHLRFDSLGKGRA
jgi:DNA primase